MALIDKSGLPIDDPWRYPDVAGEPENLPFAVIYHSQSAGGPDDIGLRGGRIWITADRKSGDGRGYTLARVLRYRYAGDLRAAGPLLPDEAGQAPADRWWSDVTSDAHINRGASDLAVVRPDSDQRNLTNHCSWMDGPVG